MWMGVDFLVALSSLICLFVCLLVFVLGLSVGFVYFLVSLNSKLGRHPRVSEWIEIEDGKSKCSLAKSDESDRDLISRSSSSISINHHKKQLQLDTRPRLLFTFLSTPLLASPPQDRDLVSDTSDLDLDRKRGKVNGGEWVSRSENHVSCLLWFTTPSKQHQHDSRPATPPRSRLAARPIASHRRESNRVAPLDVSGR